MEMGLQECADRLIGNWHLRGISGGEKRRLTIALEILTRPRLLFLDEPTTGLDSASAFFVTQILRNVSRDGRTVVCSIHQPSSEVFTLSDDLLLISGGETVYFGEAKMAVVGVMMMTAGFFRFFPDLPKPFRRYPISYINYMAWALEGEYKNDMIGLEFDPLQPGDPKLKGEVIINTVLGISLDHSKWWDLTVVVVILIVYRLLFFAILKIKERASPVFRTLYTKRTLHHLSKRPSFRKTPPFPSQRHQVMHSLSSQEGLNSQIH